MKPKSFSVTWIGPEFDGDFFGSVICGQFGMILDILGLIVEPWLSWLFWAVLVMSQRAKPKVFFCETAMVGPHTAETFLEVMWWWASGRTLMQIQPGWSSELRVGNEGPKLRSFYSMVGVSMVNFESRYSNMYPLKFSGSHPFFLYKYLLSLILYTERFVLSNSRLRHFWWSFSLESPSWDPGRWLRTRFTLKNWWRTTRPLRWSEWHRLWIVRNYDPCDLLESFGWNWLIQFILKKYLFFIPDSVPLYRVDWTLVASCHVHNAVTGAPVNLEANPGDVSKIGALSVLRKLANHLGLTSLTDHDLRVTCWSWRVEQEGQRIRGLREGYWWAFRCCAFWRLGVEHCWTKVVDYELMALPIPSWGCDQAWCCQSL